MGIPHQKLSEFGIRPTKQRLQLVALLFENERPRHFTTERLYHEAIASGISISQATVYNTVHLFCEAGLIREIAIEGQTSFYDTNTHGHPHYYHVETGALVDAPRDSVRVEFVGDLPQGTEIAGVDVVIRLHEKTSKQQSH